MSFPADVPFLCECADERCTAIIQLSLEAYEEARQRPRRFINVPGHEALSVESGAAVVAERLPGYILVDKIDGAGVIAERDFQQLDRSNGDG